MKRFLVAGVLGAIAWTAAAHGEDKTEAELKERQEIAKTQADNAAAFTPLMEGVDALEVFMLDSDSGWDERERRAKDKSPRLARWKITRQIEVTDTREIARLRAGIQRSIETGGPVMRCFEPRHGVRFTKDGRQVELILCFECSRMIVNGSPAIERAAISPAAETDFYRIFRARGLVKPARLKGMSDEKIFRQLVGNWTNSGREKDAGRRREWTSLETYSADGTYRSEGWFTIALEGSRDADRFESKDEGRWRIEDGLLFLALTSSTSEMMFTPFEYGIPILEVGRNRVVRGTTSLEKPDRETVWRRK